MPGPGLPARPGPWLAIGLGLVLLAAAALFAPAGQPSTLGEERARQLATPPDGRDQPYTMPVHSGLPPAPDDVQAPAAVHIEAIGVSAEVDEVGVDQESGQLEVPGDRHRLGWYRFSPGLDATAGSLVIAGHVDTVDGPGAFYQLGELEPGDTIEVTDADGGARPFVVVAREVHDKADIPLDRYFAPDGEFRLTLITCGGPFDRDSGHYRDNVVVTAVPA